jgi:hypothetical protein
VSWVVRSERGKKGSLEAIVSTEDDALRFVEGMRLAHERSKRRGLSPAELRVA